MKRLIFRAIFILLMFLQVVAIAWAGDNACAFLRTGVGARSLGMGGTGLVKANNATAIYWNPALLADLQQMYLDTTYSNKFTSEVEYGFVGFVYHGFGVGVLRQGVRDIEKSTSLDTNSRPIISGSFNNEEDAIYFSYGHRLNDRISIGSSLKYIYQSLDDGKANAFSLDLAGMYRIWETDTKQLRAGMNLQDVNRPAFKWSTGQSDKIPSNLKAGVAYEQKIRKLYLDKIIICLEENKRESRPWVTNAGVELSTSLYTTIRAGYNGKNMTFGASLFHKYVYIDYAFTPHTLGDTHWFSIGGKF